MRKEHKISVCGPTKFGEEEKQKTIPALADYLQNLAHTSELNLCTGGTAGFPHELAKETKKRIEYTEIHGLHLSAYAFCSGEKEEEMIKIGVMPNDPKSVYDKIIIPDITLDGKKMTGIWDIAAVRMIPLISGKDAVIAYVNPEAKGTMVELAITGVYKTPAIVLAPEETGYRRASNLAEIFPNINVTRNPEQTVSLLETILNRP